MDDAKAWYLSRTVWASLATVVLGLAGMLRLPVESVDGAALTEVLLQGATAVSGLVAIFGRLSARARIG